MKRHTSLPVRLLSVMLAILVVLSGLTLPDTTVRAKAASALPANINHNYIQSAVDKLGYGYSQSDRYGTNGRYDCSSLVMACLNEQGIYNTPWATAAWVDRIVNHTLALTYQGSYISTVYCSTIDEYESAVNNSANKGKIIVLTSLTDHDALAKRNLLKPGAMEVYQGHIAITVGSVPRDGILLGDYYSDYSMADYGYAAYRYLSANYDVPVTMVQLWEDTTNAALKKSIAVDGSYSLKNNSAFRQLGGATYTSYNSTEAAPLYTNRQAFARLVVWNSRPESNTDPVGDSEVWRIEAHSTRYGVMYSNYSYGPKKVSKSSYLVYINVDDQEDVHYASLKLNKTSMASASTYVGGAIYALIDGDVTLSKAMSLAQTAAKNTTGAEAIHYMGSQLDRKLVGVFTTNSTESAVWLKAVTKSNGTYQASSTTKILDLGKGYGSSTKTYQLVEIWAPAAYCEDANGYTLKTTATSVVPFANASWTQTSVSVSRTKGTATIDTTVGNKVSVSGGILNTADYQAYYYALDTHSKQPDASYVGGATYALGLGYDTTTGKLTEQLSSVTTETGKRTTLLGALHTKSPTKTFYMIETSAAKGCAQNMGYWKITMNGTTNPTGKGSTISSIYYYPERTSTVGVKLSTSNAKAYTYDEYGYRGYYAKGSDTSNASVVVINAKAHTTFHLTVYDWEDKTSAVPMSVALVSSEGLSCVRALATGSCTIEEAMESGNILSVQSAEEANGYSINVDSFGTEYMTFYMVYLDTDNGYAINNPLDGPDNARYWRIECSGATGDNPSVITSAKLYGSTDGVNWKAYTLKDKPGLQRGYLAEDGMITYAFAVK